MERVSQWCDAPIIISQATCSEAHRLLHNTDEAQSGSAHVFNSTAGEIQNECLTVEQFLLSTC